MLKLTFVPTFSSGSDYGDVSHGKDVGRIRERAHAMADLDLV